MIILGILATIFGMLATVAFEAFVFMHLVGVVHGEWITALPTIGYQSSLLVTTMLAAFIGVVLGASKVAEK